MVKKPAVRGHELAQVDGYQYGVCTYGTVCGWTLKYCSNCINPLLILRVRS